MSVMMRKNRSGCNGLGRLVAMRAFAISVLALAACRTQYVDVVPAGGEELAVEVRGNVPLPAACVLALSQVTAVLLIDSVDAPCPLVLEKNDDRLAFSGSCSVFSGGRARMTVRLNAVGGTSPVLAETVGLADLSYVSQPIVQINFAPEDSPALAAKTKAGPLESVTERRRFNCDIDGEDGCSVVPSVACACAPSTTPITSEIDTCSNLQELCAGTLFMPGVANACAE